MGCRVFRLALHESERTDRGEIAPHESSQRKHSSPIIHTGKGPFQKRRSKTDTNTPQSNLRTIGITEIRPSGCYESNWV
jgi:hypothetical protein